MRVLQIINSLSTGGAEKLILESIPLYHQQGIEVDLFLLDKRETPFLKQLKDRNVCSILFSPIKNVYNPLHIFSIMKIMKKYDIIHAHLFPTLYWVAAAKTISFSKTILIYTEHNTSNKRRGKWLFKLLDNFIYKKYAKIVTIAKEVDDNLKEHLIKIKPSKFQLINNGVNIQLYRNAIPYPKDSFFTNNDKILIQVSSFRPQKNQATLIKSLTLLPPNVKLLLVGTGPLQQSCENLVIQYNLEGRVKFLGNRMDVPQLLKTADIVVLSSHHEGLSLSSIEGMASGRPFIASDVPGLREIVKGYGVLFENNKESELAEKIMQLLHNKEYYNEIVSKCMFQADNFDIQLMAEKYILLYEDVLKEFN